MKQIWEPDADNFARLESLIAQSPANQVLEGEEPFVIRATASSAICMPARMEKIVHTVFDTVPSTRGRSSPA